jgi:DnaK suppressor protein
LEDLNLEHYTTLLQSRKDEIVENLDTLNKSINELQSLEVNDEGDFASVSSDSYTDNTIIAYQEEELREIEGALIKITKNPEDFGICEMCGEDIGVPRLEAKPHARYCRSCRDLVEKEINH